ncbi:hypothetical protein K492DRAFT_186450 [Lichtheimia hyalospora FSU 10163]|nr:hypothetical protein K492DRAFT_186450 [Lichtheimia hyalospora FSU 10163]
MSESSANDKEAGKGPNHNGPGKRKVDLENELPSSSSTRATRKIEVHTSLDDKTSRNIQRAKTMIEPTPSWASISANLNRTPSQMMERWSKRMKLQPDKYMWSKKDLLTFEKDDGRDVISYLSIYSHKIQAYQGKIQLAREAKEEAKIKDKAYEEELKREGINLKDVEQGDILAHLGLDLVSSYAQHSFGFHHSHIEVPTLTKYLGIPRLAGVCLLVWGLPGLR